MFAAIRATIDFDGVWLIFRSDYDPRFVEKFKQAIPPNKRRWFGELPSDLRHWTVDPTWYDGLVALCEDNGVRLRDYTGSDRAARERQTSWTARRLQREAEELSEYQRRQRASEAREREQEQASKRARWRADAEERTRRERADYFRRMYEQDFGGFGFDEEGAFTKAQEDFMRRRNWERQSAEAERERTRQRERARQSGYSAFGDAEAWRREYARRRQAAPPPPPQPNSPFKIFSVPDNADEAAVRSAYRKAAMQHHPDRGGDPEMMKKINVAKDEINRLRGWNI